jgi:hypothetical protein
MPDGTIALSEKGANELMQAYVSKANASQAKNATLGPFTVGYAVSIKATGGTVELVDTPAQLLRIHDLLLSGSAEVNLGVDLNTILPHICLPPIQICFPTVLFGTFCTPQYCPTWPAPTIKIPLPLAVNVSADFRPEVKDGGGTWDIVLDVLPLSFVIDPAPLAALILDEVKKEVHDLLDSFPLIGSLLADLVNKVLGVLQGLISDILGGLDALIHEVVLLLDLLSPKIPIKLLSFAKNQVMIPAAGPADPDVVLRITSLGSQIVEHELTATAEFA